MAKVRLARNIENVKRMYTCYLVTTKSGREYKYPYDRLSHDQSDKLFAMSDQIPQRQTIKQTRDSGRRHNSNRNAAERLVKQEAAAILFHTNDGNGNVEFAGVMEVAR